jgi:hypothetical protein
VSDFTDDALADEATNEVIQEINTFREAARQIRRGGFSKREQRVALARLAELARTRTAMPTWCQGAIWEEAEGLLWHRKEPSYPGDVVEQAIRRLLAQKRDSCPTCRRPLPSEATLRQWETLRRHDAEAAAAREAAVQ